MKALLTVGAVSYLFAKPAEATKCLELLAHAVAVEDYRHCDDPHLAVSDKRYLSRVEVCVVPDNVPIRKLPESHKPRTPKLLTLEG